MMLVVVEFIHDGSDGDRDGAHEGDRDGDRDVRRGIVPNDPQNGICIQARVLL